MAPNLTDSLGLPSSANSSDKGSYAVHNFSPKGHVIDNLAKDRLRAFTGSGQFSYIFLLIALIVAESIFLH